MEKLKYAGLPIIMDDACDLYFGPEVVHAGFGTKNSDKMAGLLYNEEAGKKAEHYYDFYRGVEYRNDGPLYEKYGYRYDLTVIIPGEIGGECKKTSGHYHDITPGNTLSDPEVYEVIKGTAMYIMQRAKNYADEKDSGVIEEVFAAVVKEGQRIIIPSNYGHCSINIGEGPLVFSNIATLKAPLNYEVVKRRHGMSYYVLRENGKIKLVKNSRYDKVPEAKVVTVSQDAAMGMDFSTPVYQAFLQNPGQFDYLAHPKGYGQKIHALLTPYSLEKL